MNARTVAIVTGASQGIGRATSLRLARDFSAVVVVARNKNNLEETPSEARSAGAEAMVFDVDLREPQAAEAIVSGTLERFGRIDALLNIAGAAPQIDLSEMTDAVGRRHGTQAARCAPTDDAGLGSVEGFEGFRGVDLPEAPLWIRNPDLRRWRRSTPPSLHSRKHSPSRESKTEFRSTA
jgi:NAD(P)-dependent dehydrogenase (short-subunit alcohol dehydrogenase family)